MQTITGLGRSTVSKEDGNKRIATIENAYAKEQYATFLKQQRQLIFKRRRLVLCSIIAVALFFIVGFQYVAERQHLAELQTIRTKTSKELAANDAQVTSLKHDVALLKDDTYVAKMARAEFFYSAEGELVFVLPDDSSGVTSNDSSSTSKVIESETTNE